MTDNTWIAGAAVLALLKQAGDETAAATDLDSGIELHSVAARYASGIVERRVGGRQALSGGPVKSKLWKRIRENYAAIDVWGQRELRLPAAGNEPATILRDLKFDERQVRSALAAHGVPDLPPPVPAKVPRKRSGGHNMGAHGAVISSVTIELLNSPIQAVRGHTETSLAELLAERFKAFDAKREHISVENRTRMARHLLANVLAELEQRVSMRAAA